MKRSLILTALSFLVLAQLGLAQVPQTINYQGVLKDNSGNIVADGNYDLTFRLYDVETFGTPLWSELQTSVPVADGVFSVTLGSNTPISLGFDIQYWLEIAVGATSLTPRIELTAVPYALNAAGVSGTDNVFPSTGDVGIGTMTPSAKLEVVGGIKADSIQLATAAERWYSIPAPEFRHAKNYTQGSSAYYVYTNNTTGDFWAPVHLPHGSTITGFEVTFTDDDSVDASIKLYSVFQGNEQAAPIASLSTFGYTATNTISDLTLSQPVDNRNYTYMVRAYWTVAKNDWDLRLKNARIRYTVDRPLP